MLKFTFLALLIHNIFSGREVKMKMNQDDVDWFGLISLFNGISTFVGYLMSKLFSKKNSSGTI